MIVKFSTGYGQITLLGESAVALLELAGHTGTIPSAVLAADLPAFLLRLRAGLEIHGNEPSPPRQGEPRSGTDDPDDARDTPAPVSLRKRAVPLLDLIETAVARGSNLMWERG